MGLHKGQGKIFYSRIRESITAFSDWNFRPNPFGPRSYRYTSRFYSFVLFLEADGVREDCCMAVESRLEALRFVRSPRATRSLLTCDEPSYKRVDAILGQKSTKLRCSWRRTQLRAAKARAKARASVAVDGNMLSIPRAAAICHHRMIQAAGGRDYECATLTCGEKQQQQ